MFNFNLSVKIYRSIVLLYATNIYFCKEIKNDIDQKMMNSMKTPQEIAEMISKRFYPLPDADLDSLASIIESSKAAKGELLLDNGQISKYLYYVESGLLRQFYYKNKRDITEHFSCEGNIVICIAHIPKRTDAFINQGIGTDGLSPDLFFGI